MNIVPNVSNKRRTNMLETTDFDGHDGVVPVLENPPKLEQSLSEPVSSTKYLFNELFKITISNSYKHLHRNNYQQQQLQILINE